MTDLRTKIAERIISYLESSNITALELEALTRAANNLEPIRDNSGLDAMNCLVDMYSKMLEKDLKKNLETNTEEDQEGENHE